MKKMNKILFIASILVIVFALGGCFLFDLPLSASERIAQFEDDLNNASRSIAALKNNCSPNADDYRDHSMDLSNYWETNFSIDYSYDFYNIIDRGSGRYDVSLEYTDRISGTPATVGAYFIMETEPDGNNLILQYTEGSSDLIKSIK